jgi:serine phosphatase RsbU (regulator of sigma subunit)
MRLMPGETMVFYTDGVTEARSPDGSFFGEDRLRQFVGAHADEHAADLAAELKNAVLKFQEGYARDDLALLVLRASRRADKLTATSGGVAGRPA